MRTFVPSTGSPPRGRSPGLGVEELDADLFEDAHRAVVDRGDALLAQRLGRAVGVGHSGPREVRARRRLAVIRRHPQRQPRRRQPVEKRAQRHGRHHRRQRRAVVQPGDEARRVPRAQHREKRRRGLVRRAGDHRARREETAGRPVEPDRRGQRFGQRRVAFGQLAQHVFGPGRPALLEIEQRAVLVEEKPPDLALHRPPPPPRRLDATAGAALTAPCRWLTLPIMTAPPPYRLHDSLGYHLSLTARLQERRLDEGLRRLGLTRISWCILLAVGNEGLEQPSDIARFVGIDRTATSRALRQMEEAGLVARKSGTDDRRTTSVRLTALGRQRLAEGTPLAEENGRILEARLEPAERSELRRLLGKLRAGEETPLSRL
jgi:MarR family transcriptional regulator for hemolysin